MYLLTPKRVNGCREDCDYDPDDVIETKDANDTDLYILPLVDARYWWQFRACPDPCSYSSGWQTLITYIAGSLGITISAATYAASYYTPHRSSWARQYHNAAQLMDAACASIGCRFVAKYDGEYNIESASNAYSNVFLKNIQKVKDAGEQIAGFECERVSPQTLPELINILFPKSSCGMLCSSCDDECIEDYYRITKSSKDHISDEDRNEICISHGASKTLHVRGYADMNCSCSSGAPANLEVLENVASQIAADWVWYNDLEYDFTFTGPFDWEPCGYDDHILHTFGVEYDADQKARAYVEPHGNQENAYDAIVVLEQERRRDYQTRVQSWPQSVGVDCLLIDTGVGERSSNYGTAIAIDCILPGTSTGTATLKAQGGAGECTITIDNTDCLIFALPGDTFPVVYTDDCASDCLWKPAGQFGTTRWARVWKTGGDLLSCDGAMDCCTSRTAYVLEDTTDSSSSAPGEYGTECCTMQESVCEITVCNTTNRKIAADKDYEDVLVTLIPGKTCLWYIHDRQRPQRAVATLILELCGNEAPEDPKVVNFQYLDVCSWQQPEEPLDVKNPYGLYACAGANVELAWNEQRCMWDIVQVPDVALPVPMLDILCHPEPDTCTIQKKVPQYPSYGHSCLCDDSTKNDDTQVTGEKFDIFYNVEDGEDSIGANVLTGADCKSGCSLEFTASSMSCTPKIFKRKRVCLYCPKDTEGDTATINSVNVGTGNSVTITGNEVDVVTGLEATWTGTDSSSGDDCPTSLGTINLTFKTKTVCVFCSDSGSGIPNRLDIDFPLEIKSVEGVTEADFSCDPCPELSVKTTMFYALCVAAEGAADVASCTCVDCVTSSS